MPSAGRGGGREELRLAGGWGGCGAGGGGVSRRSPGKGNPRAASGIGAGEGKACAARREKGHRTPRLSLREGATSLERWKLEEVGLSLMGWVLRSFLVQEELG